MKAALISLGSKSSQMIYEAMRKYFDEVDNLDIKKLEVFMGHGKAQLLYKGEPFKKYSCVLLRGSYKYASVLRAASDILQKRGTYLPIEAKACTNVHDKIITHLQLQKNDIPMPITYLSPTVTAAKKLLKTITYPIVLKFPAGTQGKGVMFAESYSNASSILDAMDVLRQPVFIQEFIDTNGEDIRVLVAGDKAVAAMRRIAVEGENRSNIHAGGHGEPVILDTQTKKIAVKAAKAVGAEVCGVDILEGFKGPVVLEVNISPGLQGITSATKVDIADKIAKYLFDKTTKIDSEKNGKDATKIIKDLNDTKEIELGKEIISEIKLRTNRIILPEIATKMSKFKENKEYVINAKEGQIFIKDLNKKKK